MTDIFWYNSGSLLQALNPSETLVDLNGEPFIANIADSFIPTVSQNGGIFGVPTRAALGGGILYNKKIYEDHGLEVPTTWAEFEANNDKLKAAGIRRSARRTRRHVDLAAVRPGRLLQRPGGRPELRRPTTPTTRSSTPTPRQRSPVSSTSRKDSTRAGTRRTSGQTQFDDGPGAPRATAKFAQYPMLTFALGTIADEPPGGHRGHRVLRPAGHGRREELRDDLDAGSHLHPEDDDGRQARRRQGFPRVHRLRRRGRGHDRRRRRRRARTSSRAPSCRLMPCRQSTTSSTTSTPATPPALEFLSPVKGPSLEQITVAVGSGLNTAEEGATCTTRTSRSRPSSWVFLAGRAPDWTRRASTSDRGRAACVRPRRRSRDVARRRPLARRAAGVASSPRAVPALVLPAGASSCSG